METQASLQRKLNGATDLKSVVRSMKAMAASNIGQYELAVSSLGDYYRAVSLGIIAYFRQEEIYTITEQNPPNGNLEKTILAIVFGSDQGLVGQFNDSVSDFVSQSLHDLPGKVEIWAVGERVQLLLSDIGYNTAQLFPVPNSVNAITPLVQQILVKSEERFEKVNTTEVYIFHNRPKSRAGYEPVIQRLLPLDEKWRQSLTELKWPTKLIPQVIGGVRPTLLALIHAYLFTTMFKACAESLASENASRLAAMQRAEKNIDELLDDLTHKFHSLRQSSIDEELFDVVSGYEMLSK
ncbi:F0F1 ATP synthase subunit gamma [Williamwhitmania taraxaci]|uniref:F-type H+-transporting ATPase subunit gamma n=1 Tax=Williamwhitmania taraxaci TaxID=1640674 RepID=A0A1G6S310_9BACT|nr:F0F1 ATP synthase subunit gamma [Williamwhitmania taraxaci]SDD11290.1 F-type H+-transporting ATPase subunit gamma [Williamwhitmania taraxaci]